MYEETQTHAYEPDAPRRRARDPEPEKPRRDRFLLVVLVQTVVCLLLMLGAFLVSRGSMETWNAFRESCTALFGREDALAAVSDAVERFGDRVFGTQPGTPTTTQAAAGAGGEDLAAPAQNASFAPYMVTGAFCVPVDYTRVSSPFGRRTNPVTNEAGFHAGTDLAAPAGTPVRAAFAGVVRTAGYSDVRGNYLVLSHGDAETLYGHCSELLVAEGTVVRAGETVALVGSTGQSTGPHLHFEVYIGGVRCDPAWLLFPDAV